MEVLSEDTIFTTSAGDGTAILRSHRSYSKGYPFVGQRHYLHYFLSYFKTLNTVNSLLDGNFWDRHYLAILRRCPSYAESTKISK